MTDQDTGEPQGFVQRSQPLSLPTLKDERPTQVAFFEHTQAVVLSGARSAPV
jgi:hypothetical protein